MGSSKSKGARRERQCRDIYEAAGFDTQAFYGRAYGETDGFNDFDFIAKNSNVKWELVQVKSNSARGVQDLCERVGREYPTQHTNVRYAVAHDGTGWRLIDISGSGKTVLVDERDESCNMGDRVTEYLAGLIEGDA